MGQLKKKVGRSSLELEFKSGATVEDVLQHFSDVGASGSVVMLRNREVDSSDYLNHGDTLYLLEPIQGG